MKLKVEYNTIILETKNNIFFWIPWQKPYRLNKKKIDKIIRPKLDIALAKAEVFCQSKEYLEHYTGISPRGVWRDRGDNRLPEKDERLYPYTN